jgi:serine/threonine-protein kinase
MTMGATVAGTILGTAAYMAPEQAKGKTADRRSDVWSFGVIVYELLTGRRMFAGESAVEILSGVLHKEPDLTAAPARVHRLLKWCLEKDRKKRLASVSDARGLLEESAPTAPSRSRFGGSVAWAAASVLALVLGAGWWHASQPVDQPLQRVNLDLPGFVGDGQHAISRDGTRVAYVTRGEGGITRLATRLLSESEWKILPGTEGALSPFFKPDGQWIGFGTVGQLKKVSVLGGAPQKLADARLLFGAHWTEDGYIVAVLNVGTSLARIPEQGGTPEPLLPSGPGRTKGPQVFPGNKSVLFAGQDSGRAAAQILALDSKKVTTLIPGGDSPFYVPSRGDKGHILYASGGSLLAAPFDPAKGVLEGQAVPVLDNWAGGASFSETGDFLYTIGAAGRGDWPLVWLKRDGTTEPALKERGRYFVPKVSPNGRKLAVVLDLDRPAESRLMVYDRDTQLGVPLTEKGQLGTAAVWTHDSQYLIWSIDSPNSKSRLEWRRADGSGPVRTLKEMNTPGGPESISPDGKYLIFGSGNARTKSDLWIASLDLSKPDAPSMGDPKLLLDSPELDYGARVSPDGKWMVWGSDESAQFEMYVQPFLGSGKLNLGLGLFPKWASGKRLIYQTFPNLMMLEYRVEGNAFVAGQPELWSKTPVQILGDRDSWSLDPLQERILAVPLDETPQAGSPKVGLLLNFFDELRRRAPVN